VRPLVMAIPRFIQLRMPSPPLKPMDQLRRGVIQVMEAQVNLKSLPEGAPEPPPHAVIDPSALRAAKAC
jgi:hypothetical protein